MPIHQKREDSVGNVPVPVATTTSLGDTTMSRRSFVLGTRGSRLARVQAEGVAAALRRARPDPALSIREISTAGDRASGSLLNWGQGVFVKDLETALLTGEIDLAVHSLKDVPTTLPDGLVLAAVPTRDDTGDVLITPAGLTLDQLRPGAVIGTSSRRRAAFLRASRSDLRIQPLRGNVDTRLRKLRDGDHGTFLDAIVLAASGLNRLNPDVAELGVEPIPRDILLPAPGQGALVVEARADDRPALDLAHRIHDPAVGAMVGAERRVLHDLGGGCQVPVAAEATVAPGGTLRVAAAVAALDGSRVVRQTIAGPKTEAEALGAALAQRLRAAGAAELLASAAVGAL